MSLSMFLFSLRNEEIFIINDSGTRYRFQSKRVNCYPTLRYNTILHPVLQALKFERDIHGHDLCNCAIGLPPLRFAFREFSNWVNPETGRNSLIRARYHGSSSPRQRRLQKIIGVETSTDECPANFHDTRAKRY